MEPLETISIYNNWYLKWGKRLIDVAVSAMALAVFSPFLALLCTAVVVRMGLPVLYMQLRPGFNAKPFWIYKFRTMSEVLDENGKLFPDEERLTKLGRFLRSTSLDELPELFNVLKGDMSIVGPRPLLLKYLKRYTPEQARRHEVKPGITGWAQVNGRNAITWEQKFEHDNWYVDNQSFTLDLKIIAMTVFKVLRREGISAVGEATMPEFRESITKQAVKKGQGTEVRVE
jgi:lipopolysaccharide/colanic/teichoic acid biosynthesis glycosyltransferase